MCWKRITKHIQKTTKREKQITQEKIIYTIVYIVTCHTETYTQQRVYFIFCSYNNEWTIILGVSQDNVESEECCNSGVDYSTLSWQQE